MNTRTLALITATAVTTLAAPLSANAQQQRHPRHAQVEEPSRFPNLRKAFRQIRSDVRYQTSAIRDTATFIRQDLEDTIRGEQRPTGAYSSQYGYRGERTPVDEYPPRIDRREYDRREYDRREFDRREFEPAFPRHAERGIPAPEVRNPQPQPEPRFRIRRRNETSPEPKIVAPRELEKPAPKIEKSPPRFEAPTPQPKSDPKPNPKPESKPKVETKAEPKAPNYPSARPSDRAGFHYSPYPPFELLDTQDVEPGGLARDPGTGKIFRVPQ